MTGGRGGIRTLGGFNPTAAFQATALNHYATRPKSIPHRRRLPYARGGEPVTLGDPGAVGKAGIFQIGTAYTFTAPVDPSPTIG
jgi:hypothetical protein